MEFFNPSMEQGSWEELIPTITFSAEIPHSNYDDLTDDSWKTLAACNYKNGGTSSLTYEIVADALHTSMAEDNDLGMYLNDRPSTPPPQEVATYTSGDPMYISPNSSVSSGVFSCSDFEALSPPSFECPGSPDVFNKEEDHSSYHSNQHNQHYMTYNAPSNTEYMTINQRLLSYAIPRTTVQPTRSVPIHPASYNWSSQMASQNLSSQMAPQNLPKTTARAFNKPPESYIALISKAILSTPSRRALLSDIYNFALENYEYYRVANKTWKNAIRHNLSINECFIKNGRAPQGRGFYWSIHPACVPNFVKGDFRRREARQLAVDMDKLKKETAEKQSTNNCYM